METHKHTHTLRTSDTAHPHPDSDPLRPPKLRALQTTAAFILLQRRAGAGVIHSQAASEGAGYWGHTDWTPK